MYSSRRLERRPPAADGCWRAVAVKSDQPLLVVGLELDVQRLSRPLDGTKRLHPHKLFLERPDKAFDIAVALGRPNARIVRVTDAVHLLA